MNATTERTRALNDELRRNLPNGHAVMTAGIAALGPEAVARFMRQDFFTYQPSFQAHCCRKPQAEPSECR